MYTEASPGLRILYCLAVISAVFPYGMSGWVALTLGASPRPVFFMALPMLFLAVGLWRIYRVARYPHTLASYTFEGSLKAARSLGILGMIIAVLYLIVRLGSGPWIRALDRSGDISTRGIASYVFGVYFAMFQGLTTLGITLFEFSRLMAFEKHANSPIED